MNVSRWLLVVSMTVLPTALLPVVEAGNSSQCSVIQDPDQRANCRAQADRNSSQCSFIQNSDLRAMCRAQVERKPSQCSFIQNSDLRAQCRALAGG
jgi:hypothetical protein